MKGSFIKALSLTLLLSGVSASFASEGVVSNLFAQASEEVFAPVIVEQAVQATAKNAAKASFLRRGWNFVSGKTSAMYSSAKAKATAHPYIAGAIAVGAAVGTAAGVRAVVKSRKARKSAVLASTSAENLVSHTASLKQMQALALNIANNPGNVRPSDLDIFLNEKGALNLEAVVALGNVGLPKVVKTKNGDKITAMHTSWAELLVTHINDLKQLIVDRNSALAMEMDASYYTNSLVYFSGNFSKVITACMIELNRQARKVVKAPMKEVSVKKATPAPKKQEKAAISAAAPATKQVKTAKQVAKKASTSAANVESVESEETTAPQQGFFRRNWKSLVGATATLGLVTAAATKFLFRGKAVK
jgi:hypothetical protein